MHTNYTPPWLGHSGFFVKYMAESALLDAPLAAAETQDCTTSRVRITSHLKLGRIPPRAREFCSFCLFLRLSEFVPLSCIGFLLSCVGIRYS